MRILLTCLSLALFISCKKEKNKSIQKDDAKDSLTIKKESVEVKKDSITSVNDIKKEYAAVSTLLEAKKIDSTAFKYNCDEREGEVVFYYQDKNLKAVKHFYAEYSHFSSSTQYFVKNDKVFFIFKDETVWNFDGGTSEKPETKDNIKEQRIYVLNDKAVQCLEKSYSIKSAGDNQNPNTIANKETKCDISELMKTYQQLIRNKNKKGEIKCL
ncbi:hypothetical protein [Chryseobacterium daeguense]|uniref:hypothetical protein n=1 Tax=Chryseobacterium daeguense TaxID=412438 RepID=UPI00041A9B10|nr:hypothetical protein [Chryseobacterium daeguense]